MSLPYTWSRRGLPPGLGLNPENPGFWWIIDAVDAGGTLVAVGAMRLEDTFYPAILTSDDGIEWKVREPTAAHPFPLFTAVAFGNNVLIVVGPQGRIWRSLDLGASWEILSAAGGYSGGFSDVAYGAGMWVAVGQSGEIQTSVDDGDTWVQQSPDDAWTGDFRGVDYGAGFFVVVGTNQIQRSADGVVWDARSSGLVGDFVLHRVAHGDGNWVAVGVEHALIVSDDDGATWTPIFSGSPEDFVWLEVAWGDGRFLVTGTTLGTPGEEPFLFLVSRSDQGSLDPELPVVGGLYWDLSAVPSPVFGGVKFYSAVWHEDAGEWLAIADTGLLATTGPAAPVSELELLYLGALQDLLPPGPAWTREPDAELTQLLLGAAAEPARVHRRALDLIEEVDPRTTTELIDDWFRVCKLPGPCDAPQTLAEKRAYLHAHLLGFGDPNRQFWIDLLEALGLLDVVLTNRHDPFAAGHSAAGDPLSNDAWQHTFMLRFESASAALNSRAACKVRQIEPEHCVSVVAPVYWHTWVAAVITGTVGILRGVCHTGAVWLAVGDGGEVLESADGLSFTEQASGVAENLFAVFASAAGSAWALGAAGTILFTDDAGATWTPQTPDDAYAGTFRAGAAAPDTGTLVIVGTGGEIQRSTDDGTTWAHVAPADAYADAFRAICAIGGGVWLAVGQTSCIQESNDDGLTWSTVDALSNDTFAAVAHFLGRFWMWAENTVALEVTSEFGTGRYPSGVNMDFAAAVAAGPDHLIVVGPGDTRVAIVSIPSTRVVFEARDAGALTAPRACAYDGAGRVVVVGDEGIITATQTVEA